MKTNTIIYLQMSLCCAALMALASCEGAQNPQKPTPTISFGKAEVTHSSITLSVAAENADAIYYDCRETVVTTLPEAEEVKTYGDAIPGNAVEISLEELKPATTYTILAVSSNESGYSDVIKQEFTTGVDNIDCSFNIEYSEITTSSFNVKINPSDNEAPYISFFLAESVFTENNIETDDDIHEFIKTYLEESNGIPFSEILQSIRQTGITEGKVKNLIAETTYRGIVYCVDSYGNRISDISRKDVTTEAVEETGMTFELSADNITPSSVHIKIVPSDMEKTYSWFIDAKENYPDAQTARDYADAYLEIYGWILDMGEEMYTGITDMEYTSVTTGNTYVLVAFPYDQGLNGEPQMIEFTIQAK